MTTKIDHIVVGAATLADGVAYVKDKLGVDIPKGGEHPNMATHNHLMQLGNNTFLEIIAINPDGKPPKRPRWFGLDDPMVRASIVKPRLLTWVVNTTDLMALQTNAAIDIGERTPLSRGDLNWFFMVPDDGRLLSAGTVPYALQWQTDEHPSANMAQLQCQLKQLRVYHPYADWYKNVLDSLQASALVSVHDIASTESAYMIANIETPAGAVELDSRIDR